MKNLFVTRNFWIAVISLLVMLLGVFFPGFGLDLEHAAGLAVITASYLVAFSINPSGEGLAAMFLSRKFWAALIGFAVVFLDAFKVFPAPLNIESLAGFVVLITAYVVALAKDPGNGWRGLIVSRKFWSAIVGVGLTFLSAFQVVLPVGLTADQVVGMVLILSGVIASVGIQGTPVPMPNPEEIPF